MIPNFHTVKQRLDIINNVRVDVGIATKFWLTHHAHAAFLPDLLFANAVQCPKTRYQVVEHEVFVLS